MFESKEEFCDYLKVRLIPDLREDGRNSTADDFDEALYWMGEDPTR